MMIKEILDVLSIFDFPQLIAIGMMFWFFKKHIDNKFDKRFDKMEGDIIVVHRRMDIMHQRFDVLQQNLITSIEESNRRTNDLYKILVEKIK
jgi:hypothetical protein